VRLIQVLNRKRVFIYLFICLFSVACCVQTASLDLFYTVDFIPYIHDGLKINFTIKHFVKQTRTEGRMTDWHIRQLCFLT